LSPARRRRAIDGVVDVLHVSERHAFRVIGQHRSTQRRPEPLNPYRDRLVTRMRCLAQSNPRRGRKHILDLLHGEGWRVGTRLMKRPWRAEGLLVPQSAGNEGESALPRVASCSTRRP
jgi:putative transposase